MNKFGLIGKNIYYSFSKGYFTEKFKKLNLDSTCNYEIFDLQNINEIKELFENPNLKGFNVTIPYKQLVIPFLDEISDSAKKIGAVNTIEIKDGKKIGHNTDSFGFENSLIPLLENHHKKALILGNGGAAKAVTYILEKLSIDYKIVSRNSDFSYENLTKNIINSFEIIINTTPLGTFPNIDQTPLVPFEYLNSNHLVYDLIYNPEKTLFLKNAEKQNCKIKNGLEMLHLQADKAWDIWSKSI